jgi:hypothetical protein
LGDRVFVVLWAYNLSFQTFLREDEAFISFIISRRFLLIAFILGGAHLLFMGYEGWMKPGAGTADCHLSVCSLSLHLRRLMWSTCLAVNDR